MDSDIEGIEMKLPVVLRALSLLTLMFIVCACAPPVKPPPGSQLFIKHPIKLKVNNSSGTPTLVIDEPANQACKNTVYKKGCILVGQGGVAQIHFKLLQRAWHITQMQVCAGGDKPSDFSTECTLSPEQVAEFLATDLAFFIWPDANGKMDLTALSTDLQTFYFRDFNWLPGDYFYRIQVCPDGDDDPDKCIWTDPPIRNKGRR